MGHRCLSGWLSLWLPLCKFGHAFLYQVLVASFVGTQGTAVLGDSFSVVWNWSFTNAPMQATAVGYAEQLSIARLSVNSSHDGSCHAEVLGERPLDCRCLLPTSFAGKHFTFRSSHCQKKSTAQGCVLQCCLCHQLTFRYVHSRHQKLNTARCCRLVLTSGAVVFQCCQNWRYVKKHG